MIQKQREPFLIHCVYLVHVFNTWESASKMSVGTSVALILYTALQRAQQIQRLVLNGRKYADYPLLRRVYQFLSRTGEGSPLES